MTDRLWNWDNFPASLVFSKLMHLSINGGQERFMGDLYHSAMDLQRISKWVDSKEDTHHIRISFVFHVRPSGADLIYTSSMLNAVSEVHAHGRLWLVEVYREESGWWYCRIADLRDDLEKVGNILDIQAWLEVFNGS